MSTEHHKPAPTPCLCNALRQASRAVSRIYDEELRGMGQRATQYSLFCHLRRAGEVRQRDLDGLTSLDETTLTRNLRPLIASGWVAIGTGEDRREKLVRLTEAGAAKLRQARPAWERAQERLRSRLPGGVWSGLLATVPDLARLTDEAFFFGHNTCICMFLAGNSPVRGHGAQRCDGSKL
jgi:DNA-binding MarR family transcriptional regulator